MSKQKLSVRDEEILFFLWRWKIATTRNLALRFYSGKSFRAAYVSLWRLERAGWLSSHTTANRRDHFWILTDYSYRQLVKPRLPGLIQDGYKSEYVEHDFIVNAVHLGEFIVAQPPHVSLFSEQELRRYDPEFYPAWVPQSKIHRPDGYSLVSNGNEKRLVAFEIELSQKKLEIYENVGRFYFEDTKVADVLWLVGKQSHAKGILQRIKTAIGPKSNIHSFILLNDFHKHQWQSTVVIGKNKGISIAKLVGICAESSRNHDSKIDFFDTRKSLRKSIQNKKSEPRVHLNRGALSRSSQKTQKGML